jgi:polyisoprenoid-binding protein YceI
MTDFTALTGEYTIDPDHSRLGFVARHAMVTKVRGSFNEFEGDGYFDAENPANSRLQLTIQAASIDTRNDDRDEHLRSPDFLDADNHPTLEFRSTGLRHEAGEWLLDGDLTVAGQTRPVSLDVEFEGGALDPWGNARVGFSATTQVNREDFGLTWNQALETGGWLVGRDVRIELSVEGIQQ